MARWWLLATMAVLACGEVPPQEGWGGSSQDALTLLPMSPLDGGDDARANLEDPQDVVLDAADNIFVTDQKPIRILMFDSGGHYVQVFGRDGEGPGEYANPRLAVGPAGLLVHDAPLSRLTMFDWQGGVRWTRTGPCCRLFPPRISAKGELFAAEGPLVIGVSIKNYSLVRFDGAGTPLDTTEIPAPGAGEGGAWRYVGPEMATAVAIPFAAYTYVIVTPKGTILVGRSGEYALAELRSAVDTVRVVRRPWTPVRIPDSTKMAAIDELALGYREYSAEAVARRFMKIEDVPEVYPAIAGLHVDQCQRWWVRRTSIEAGGPTVFDVFTGEGVFLGTTTAPVALSRWGVGRQVLAGIGMDASGVPRLVRLRLRNPRVGCVGDGWD